MQLLSDKVTGDTLPADQWNQPMSELENVITAFGQSLTSGDLNQHGKSIVGYVGSGDAYIDSGSANQITLTPLTGLQPPPKYTDKQRVRYTKVATNTSAVFINVAGLGNIKLLDQTGADLASGDQVLGQDYEVRYDPTLDGGNPAFRWEKPAALTNTLGRGYIDGFITSNNGTDAANDIDIAPGACKDSTNTIDMFLNAALGKQIDVVWAEGGTPGTPAGGFPSGLSSGSPVNNTWYRVFAIRRASGQIDAGFDTSSNAANLLADAVNYTEFRQIGWVRRGVGANLAYFQNGDRFWWDTQILDVDSVTGSTAGTLETMTAPPETIGIFNAKFESTLGLQSVIITEVRADNVTPVNGGICDMTSDAGAQYAQAIEIMRYLDASSQIRRRSTATTITLDIATNGWIDTRGAEL